MNELVPYQDIVKMAMAISKSGLFGVKTADQAIALMLVAQAEGRHPAMAARDYDIINNRPAKKADAMLRDFQMAGGTVKWHELSDTCAKATFSHSSGGSLTIDWDLARAKKAGLDTKEMYKKYPRAMLRSRCISEGIKATFPAATSGMYAPEEADDIVDVTPGEIVDGGAVLDQFASEGTPALLTGDELLQDARAAALHGIQWLRDYYLGLTQEQRAELRPYTKELQEAAEKADAEPEPVGR